MTVFIYIVSGSFSDENYDIKKKYQICKRKKKANIVTFFLQIFKWFLFSVLVYILHSRT